MKLKSGFILQEIGTDIVVVPSGEELNLNLMITLNGTGRFLWERLDNGAEVEDLVKALLSEYDVDEEKAQESVNRFIQRLEKYGFLE